VDRSRPINKANAVQLGVREDDILADSRVCQTCWCKTLKTKCQLLSCSTPGKNKKLRHLPAKWKELSPGLKETLSNELQIPEGTKQVCTTCFGRINKRISQAQEDEVARDTNSTNSRDTKETYKVGEVIWSNEEVTLLEMALRELGTDWAKIASKVPDKKASECKKFFYAHRKKLGLNEMVADYKKSVGASNGDKPSLSSDEEYSTSSCDDENDKQNDKKTDGKCDEKVNSSDVVKTVTTTTVPSTPCTTTATSLTSVSKKEDGYDSAATVSADETHEQDKKLHPPSTQVMVTTAPGGATVVTVGLPMAAPPPGTNIKPIANNVVSSASSAAAFLPPGVVVSTGMMNAGAGGPPVVPVTKTIYVKDIMNTVIDESFRPNAHQNRTNEVSTIKDLLKDPHSTISLPPGLMKPPPADLEVKPVPAPAAAHGAPQPGGAGEASGVVEDSGVLNLTTTKRDRTTPAPYPGLSEPMFKSTYVERGHHPGPSSHPISRGEKPPDAHCESKKTTHRETMELDNRKLTEFSKNESSTPSNHGHSRQEIMSSPYQHMKPGHKLEGGSITHGRPIPQHPQHPTTPRSYNHPTQIKNMARGGSLVAGTPVYTDNRQDSRSSQALDIIKKQQQQAPAASHQQSRYPPYSIRQPVHSESNSRGSTSSRHVIENDYMTAQSLPRKDTHDDLRAGYPSRDHRAPPSDRDIQIVETHPRFEPRPNSMYGAPRAAHPYGAPFRTDPKADIPPRDPIRPDPRTETHDPRYQPDLRRAGFPPGYPGSMSLPRDARSRSPPRSTVSVQRPMSSSGGMSRTPGSITTGVPRSTADIAHRGQPEVSITKQTVNQLPSRPDYPNTNLVNFADIALQQPKMADLGRGVGVSGVGSSSSNSLTVTRTDPNAAANQRLQAELKSKYDALIAASTFKYSDPRYVAGLSREQQAELFKQLQLGAEDKHKDPYNRHPNNLNAEQVIEMIISNQIKNNLQQQPNSHGLTPGLTTAYGQLAVNNLAGGALPRLDGKESPNKSSRSPLVKDGIDERMLMRTSPAGLPPNSMEHLEAMKKDSQRNRTSPYPMPAVSSADLQDYWKRGGKFGGGVDPAAYMPRPPSQGASLPRPGSGGMPAPPSLGTSDERQIIRVAQNASPRSDKGSVSGRPAVEAISPPTSDPARSTPNYSYQDVNRYRRKPNEIDQAAVQSSGAVFDYVKGKIAEQMKTLDPRTVVGSAGPTNPTMGPPNKRALDGGTSVGNQGPTDLSAESPRKRHKPDDGAPDLPDSPGSGEMVIDESARPDSAHSQKTTSPAPHPNDYSNYRGGGPPAHTGAPPPPPPSSSMPPRSSPSGGPPLPRGGPMPPSTSAGGPPPPGTRYEPLSDDD